MSIQRRPQDEEALTASGWESTGAREEAACPVGTDMTSDVEHDEAVNRWIAAIERDVARRRRFDGWLPAYLFGFLLCKAADDMITGGALQQQHSITRWLAWAVLVVYGLFRLRLKTRIARRVSQENDVRLVGALVDIWNVDSKLRYDKRTRASAQDALIRLLPQLTANDGHLLDESRRAILRKVLTFSYEADRFAPELQIAVIRAFHRIWDWKSAPGVKSLTVTIWSDEVCKTASECLPDLQQLYDRMQASAGLLRASEAPAPTADTLLRPAQAALAEEKPDELLRPSASENPN